MRSETMVGANGLRRTSLRPARYADANPQNACVSGIKCLFLVLPRYAVLESNMVESVPVTRARAP